MANVIILHICQKLNFCSALLSASKLANLQIKKKKNSFSFKSVSRVFSLSYYKNFAITKIPIFFFGLVFQKSYFVEN